MTDHENVVIQPCETGLGLFSKKIIPRHTVFLEDSPSVCISKHACYCGEIAKEFCENCELVGYCSSSCRNKYEFWHKDECDIVKPRLSNFYLTDYVLLLIVRFHLFDEKLSFDLCKGVLPSKLAKWCETTYESLPDSIKKMYSFEDFYSLFLVFKANGFGSIDQVTLFNTISRTNHGCLPNAQQVNNTLVSLREIQEGEEILICYTHECNRTLMFDERQIMLKNHWGFLCECVACSDPISRYWFDSINHGILCSSEKCLEHPDRRVLLEGSPENVFDLIHRRVFSSLEKDSERPYPPFITKGLVSSSKAPECPFCGTQYEKDIFEKNEKKNKVCDEAADLKEALKKLFIFQQIEPLQKVLKNDEKTKNMIKELVEKKQIPSSMLLSQSDD
eukprot:GDKJ01052983.1.p1 GENE.GDKJ01052983.1~~GDKJ01052983.1.p1  ORF type:complete len:390 (+),score=50.57 GDKJ01052983.1:27-1196(+)